MNVKTILIFLLVVIAVIMIYLGIKADMKPPIVTGIGFIIIGILLGKKK